MSQPLSVFISYAHEDRALMLELIAHLSPLVRSGDVVLWQDGMMLAGKNWKAEIDAKLDAADIIIFLISSDFMNAGFIWDEEVPRSYKRAKAGYSRVIPVLLRPCHYYYIDSKVMLPRNEQNDLVAINSPKWESRDAAFMSVVTELKKCIQDMRGFSPEDNLMTLFEKAGTLNQQKTDENNQPNENTIDNSKVDVKGDFHQGNKNSGGQFNAPVQQVNNFYGPVNNTTPEAPTVPLTNSTRNVWENIRLKKGLPKIFLLALDRHDFYNKLMTDFDEKVGWQCNLFYFICGCQTQCPEEVAKRMIYFCEDIFTVYARKSGDFDDIAVLELDIKRTPVLTLYTFWEQLKDSLPDQWKNQLEKKQDENMTPVERFAAEFAEFAQASAQQRFMRYPILCRVNDNQWNKAVEKHLDYIIHTFAQLPIDAQKFVFLFILEMDDLHNCDCQPDHPVLEKRQKINTICEAAYNYEITQHGYIFEIKEYVSAKDVEKWLGSLIEDSVTVRDCYQLVMEALYQEILTKKHEFELQLFRDQQVFYMDRFVSMQPFIHQYSRQLSA